MFDIGTMELLVVAVLAVIVVGPRDLPKLLRGVSSIMRQLRSLATEFRAGVDTLAAEVEREIDPFGDLKEEEGLTPGMSPEEITKKIMANREQEADRARKAARAKAEAEHAAAAPAAAASASVSTNTPKKSASTETTETAGSDTVADTDSAAYASYSDAGGADS